MKRISDTIAKDEILKWNNDVVTISAPTGSGKSYFIKNILYEVAREKNKKILMLIHRTNCIDQFKSEIMRDNKCGIIDIKSYQSIEVGGYFDFIQYDYIVCDEFHYFIGDAAFNKNTDVSLNLILNLQNTTRIFMSATGEYTKNYLNNIKNIKTLDYTVPSNYGFIKNLSFFNTDQTMESIVEELIYRKEKAIFFIDSATKAYQLYSKYKQYCFFNCSKGNKYYKHVDEEKINNMLVNEKFSDLILITTTAFDSGINIIDKDLTRIIIDVKDILSLIQCLGRKRIQDKNDKIDLYIKTMNNSKLSGLIVQLKNKTEKAEFLISHSAPEYVEKYSRQSDKYDIVYDVILPNDKIDKKVNELMYYRCLLDIETYSRMKEFGSFGYSKYIANMFSIKYTIMKEEDKKNSLEEFLDSKVGTKLYKKNQKELIEAIDVHRNRRLLKSPDTLTSALKEINIMYEIRSETDWNRKNKDGTKNSNYSKTYWVVYRLVKQ